MKSYRGAVFFDYDGTLTEPASGSCRASERTRAAIRALRDNGYLAILCTGRAVPYASDSGVDFDGMVTSNGTYVTVDGEEILNCPVEEGLMRRFTARLNEMGIDYCVDHPIMCMAPDPQSPDFVHWLTTFAIPAEGFRRIEPGETPVGYKFGVLYHTDEEIARLIDEFGDQFTFPCQRATHCADVNIRGFDKSTGVKAIIEHFKLEAGATYAFGDAENDLPMLKAVGHGVAMGDHAPALEEVAEFVTRRVCDEGIEYGLKHYDLI